MDRLIRDCIRNLTPYAAGCREGEFLLLDANESSEELPDFLIEEVLNQLRRVNRYPDDGRNLKAKLADFLGHGISEDNIILTNGSDGGINLIANTFLNPGDVFLTVEPTFSMYKFYCSLAGGTHQRIMSLADFRFPLEQVKELLEYKAPKLFFVCSPNNPTGGTLSLAELEGLMDCAQDTVVVVDNAYIEFGGESALPLLSKYPNLIILRTFSKALGLAGLRIGYCIAQGGTIALMKKALPPYLVSSLALALGEIILDNCSLVSERIKEIVSERQVVFNELSAMPGLKVCPSQGNFLFVRTQDPQLGLRLREKGILVRLFGDEKLRISIGSKTENLRLLEEIANG